MGVARIAIDNNIANVSNLTNGWILWAKGLTIYAIIAPSKIKVIMGNKIPSDKRVNKINRIISGEIDDILGFENIIFSPI